MLIASYNQQLGDVLILILGPNVDDQVVTKKDNVVKIADQDGHPIGFNIFNACQILPELKKENGQLKLSQAELDQINHLINERGFNDQVQLDDEPRFVVGYVKSIQEHPKSDHLKITETEIDGGKTLQIVSGSPNMQANIKVVVAKVGAMMPSGMIIWPGNLKGVESDGMICSGRELRLPNAPQRPGALILPDDYEVGTPFDFAKGAHLFQ